MLWMARDVQGTRVTARDGPIGKVEDVLFDDQSWTVRYIVVNTGGWLTGRLVLVTPEVVEITDGEDREVRVSRTQAEVRESPEISEDRPVSLQREVEHHRVYGAAPYWGGPVLWGPGLFPVYVTTPADAPHRGVPTTSEDIERKEPPASREQGDPHLRSAKEVMGYSIRASDGEIGHVEDFLLENDTWRIAYVEIDTKNWWPGKKVVAPPVFIQKVSWSDSIVEMDLTREQIREGPEYEASRLTDPGFAEQLRDYYQQLA